jgi:hypothetical protein
MNSITQFANCHKIGRQVKAKAMLTPVVQSLTIVLIKMKVKT